MVQVSAAVRRNGERCDIPVEALVPGDLVLLSAGDMVPGDCRLLQSRDLFVDEASLTGETYPAEKGVAPGRAQALFMGTHVISGEGTALVISTGRSTEFGKVAERLRLRPAETEFERGVRRFGTFLMEVTLIMVLAIFAVNAVKHLGGSAANTILDSFLFALALAVGLTPQLLPAIISVNLAQGARRMAHQKVIVKRLAAIENFGSMDVLCADKTGTLTEGRVRLHAALDCDGNSSARVLLFAWLNASFETGFRNPIDEAIRAQTGLDRAGYEKRDEIPYDFVRKRLSILVAHGDETLLITKGALDGVLAVCTRAETGHGETVELAPVRDAIRNRADEFGRQGCRVLGIACRTLGRETAITRDDEREMTFAGFLVLADPPKLDTADAIRQLQNLGVRLKVITGDSRLVAASVGAQVGIETSRILTGADLHQMSDEALVRQVSEIDLFAEVEPNHKERVIIALKKAGHVTGFLGDGINDASALHAADVGISVDSAVDVAREAADIVLLEKDLRVLADGVRAGRVTFANTLKYVFMATSANFGNMFSMAAASLFLPFLPLLPKQILLTNLLTDLPEMTIAGDNVDPELVERPRRWDIRFIRRFMIVFGPLSSVFDFLTFGVLLLLLHARPDQFRTGWFVESVVSAALIVLVVRTRRSSFRSRPALPLAITTLAVVLFALLVPLIPDARLFGFTPLPVGFYGLLAVIALLYIAAAEAMKRVFYRRT